jgi:hypothetical protein
VPAALWYGMLSVVLLVVWAMSGRDSLWPIWPILGFALLVGWQACGCSAPGPRAVNVTATATAEPPSGPVRTMPVTRRVLPFSSSAVVSR